MTVSRILVGLTIALLFSGTSIRAQWPAYPDSRVRRTADGRPNFDAPTPRTGDGKPDLSGIWLNEWFYGGQVKQPPVSPPGEPPASTFANIGAGFPNGLPFEPWAKELMEKRKEQNSKDNPDAHCLPMGLMQDIWGSPFTSAAKITERFRRLNYGVMKVDVTIDDPKAYTKPFSVRVNQRVMPDGELIEFICNENNKAPQLMVGK